LEIMEGWPDLAYGISGVWAFDPKLVLDYFKNNTQKKFLSISKILRNFCICTGKYTLFTCVLISSKSG
jgi:hypothetical protein